MLQYKPTNWYTCTCTCPFYTGLQICIYYLCQIGEFAISLFFLIHNLCLVLYKGIQDTEFDQNIHQTKCL